jgi:antitoxin PrlF
MPTATITSKGQITIPIEVRKKLGLKAGVKIDFFEDEEGSYSIRPKTGSIMEMKGILRRLGYVPTIEEMDRDILKAASEDYLRSVSGKHVSAENENAS